MITIRVIFVLLGLCGVLVSGPSYADYAIPGCEDAWDEITKARKIRHLETLIINDCTILYRRGWRLPVKGNNAGNYRPKICGPAWQKLHKANQLKNVKFMVTHNCPVFYRKKWVVPHK